VQEITHHGHRISRRRGLVLAGLATLLTIGLILGYRELSVRLWAILRPGPLPAITSLTGFALAEVLVILVLVLCFDSPRGGPLGSGRGGCRRWMIRGIAIGLIANALGPAILSVMGKAWLSPAPAASAKMVAFAAIGVPISALWEELVFRGCILRWLRPSGTLLALTLSSLTFAGVHFVAEPLYAERLLLLVSFGFLLGTAYLASGSLWFAIGVHLGVNIIGFLLADAPAAGGVWRLSISLSQGKFTVFLLSGVITATALAAVLPKALRDGVKSV
jgi:membrane protease YdiL (CAAX protease family)